MTGIEWLNALQVALLLIAIGLLLRVLAAQREATRIARQTKHEAARAATDAREAAKASKAILDRMLRAADEATHRADATDDNAAPGEAADAAAGSPRDGL